MQFIDNFVGKNSWLSMGAASNIEYRGVTWPSITAALTASKIVSQNGDLGRATADVGHGGSATAHAMFNYHEYTHEWYSDPNADGGYVLLEMFLRQYFSDTALARKLIDTGDAELLSAKHTASSDVKNNFKYTNMAFQVRYSPDQLLLIGRLHQALTPVLLTWRAQGASRLMTASETFVPAAGSLPYTVRKSPLSKFIVRFVNGRLACQSLAGRIVDHGPAENFFSEDRNLIEEEVMKVVLTDCRIMEGTRVYIGLNMHGKALMKLRQELQNYGRLLS